MIQSLRTDRWFLPLVAAVFLGAIDQTVVAATLPAIVLDLGLPINRLDEVSWSITAYLAGYALMLPIAGQIADRMRRLDRFVAVCLAVFALGSLVVGLGQDLASIVSGRFVQAVGAGALLPVALGRLSGRSGIGGLVQRIGWVTAIAEGGALLGPVYGATAIQVLDWRWIFLLNVPACGILIAWLAWQWHPSAEVAEARQVDWPGALALGASLGLLTLAASQNVSGALSGNARPLLLALGAVLVALLIAQERRATQPMLPSWLVRSHSVASSLLTHLLGGGAFMVPLLVVPLWGNTLLGQDAAQSALLLARLTLTIPIGALAGSRAPERVSAGMIASVGMLITSVALALMASWSEAIEPTAMTPALLLTGLGFGLMIAPTNAAAIQTAGPSNAATVASLVQAARLVGMTLASAWLATYGLDQFNARVSDISIGDPAAYIQAVRASAQAVFTELFLVGAGLAVLGAVASLGISRSASRSGAAAHPESLSS
jgi:MFS family permease